MILLPAIISALANAVTSHGGSSASSSGGNQPTTHVSDATFKSLVASLSANGKPVAGGTLSSSNASTNATGAANADES